MNHELDVFARLAPGVSIEAADRELHAIATQMAPSLPAVERGWRTRLVPARRGHRRRISSGARCWCCSARSGCCCSSPARTSRTCCSSAPPARSFELAIRRALGESRGRAIGQLLVESLVVTAVGGALGILLASWSVEALRTLPIARVAEIAVDPRVLAVAIAATLLSGVIAGVGPAHPRHARGAAGRAAVADGPPGAALPPARRHDRGAARPVADAAGRGGARGAQLLGPAARRSRLLGRPRRDAGDAAVDGRRGVLRGRRRARAGAAGGRGGRVHHDAAARARCANQQQRLRGRAVAARRRPVDPVVMAAGRRRLLRGDADPAPARHDLRRA